MISNTKNISSLEDNIFIYPNPNSGEFNMRLIKGIQKANIVVYDTHGKIVYEEFQVDVGDNKSMDLTRLEVGTYFIQCTTEKGSLSKKLVITR